MTTHQASQPVPPPGFRPIAAAETTGPRVKREALASGVIVQYRATRKFPRVGDDRPTVVHIFLARGGKGARFSVFGTAQLDSKLDAVTSGAILWIQYAGKKLIDAQETHDWNISDAGNRLSDIQLGKLLANSTREHDALDLAIKEAEADNAVRMHGASGDNYEPTDDDALAAGAR